MIWPFYKLLFTCKSIETLYNAPIHIIIIIIIINDLALDFPFLNFQHERPFSKLCFKAVLFVRMKKANAFSNYSNDNFLGVSFNFKIYFVAILQ